MSLTTTLTGTITSSVPSTATPTTASCGATLYDIPAPDAACALAYGGNHTAILSACCGSADIVSYADNCGLYCLAEDSTVAELTACMFDHGAGWADLFCNAAGNDTADASAADAPLSSGASVIPGSASSKSATSSGAEATGSESASNASAERVGMSFSGATVSGLLLFSVLLGAFQL